jgi:hypothetical protein
LVVAQVAVSFMLLIGAGLMMRSFVRLQQVPTGFSPDHLLTMRLSPNFSRFTSVQQLNTLRDTILRQIPAIAGVESAALSSNFPFNPRGVANGPGGTSFEIEGRPVSKGELAPLVDINVVSPDYFRTIRQPLLQGRTFTDHDDANALRVCLINQTMARHRWPSEDPIGKRVSFQSQHLNDHGQQWITIAGVIGDAKEYGLDRPVGDETYVPLAHTSFAGNLVVRTAAEDRKSVV